MEFKLKMVNFPQRIQTGLNYIITPKPQNEQEEQLMDRGVTALRRTVGLAVTSGALVTTVPAIVPAASLLGVATCCYGLKEGAKFVVPTINYLVNQRANKRPVQLEDDIC